MSGLYSQITVDDPLYDGIHQNAAGAQIIADTCYQAAITEPGSLTLLGLGGFALLRH